MNAQITDLDIKKDLDYAELLLALKDCTSDILKYLQIELEGITDHPEEDCDCYLTLYVRFDKKDNSLVNFNYNSSDMESEPYTNSRNWVVTISICPAVPIESVSELYDQLISSLEANIYD